MKEGPQFARAFKAESYSCACLVALPLWRPRLVESDPDLKEGPQPGSKGKVSSSYNGAKTALPVKGPS